MNVNFDNYTVRGLRAIARREGLRGYSSLNRQNLIQFLIDRGRPILDTRVENINVPILQLTIAQPLPSTSRQEITTTTTASVNDLLRSLENVQPMVPSISPEIKALKDKINDIFEKSSIIKVIKHKSALKLWAEEYKIPGFSVSSPAEFLELSQPSMLKVLKSKRGTKVKMVLKCLMYLHYDVENPVEANFSSDINEINLDGTDVTELYYTMVDRILENYQNFLRKGSGWAFHSVVHLKLHTVAYEPLRASSYIPLPKWISNKKACINMKNEDDEECFTWSILRHLNPTDSHPERIDGNLKSKKNSLNMKGITYPVSLHDIDKFERQNPEISVNVYKNDDNKKNQTR